LAIEAKYAMWSRPTDLAIFSSLVSIPATKRAVPVGLLGSPERGGGSSIAQSALKKFRPSETPETSVSLAP
jgi:hypothetical protein